MALYYLKKKGRTDMLDIVPLRFENDRLMILDQTLLPGEERFIEISTKEDIWDAIHELKVRGAPAIGVAAAFGIYRAIRDTDEEDYEHFYLRFAETKRYIATSRPTAVNLFWALERMEKCLIRAENSIREENWKEKQEKLKAELLKEAEQIRKEDEQNCISMGKYGLTLLEPGMGILTHCNAGTIATARYGTCLAPIYLGQEKGYRFRVFADETRPLLQGARLTAWELTKAGVDVTLICDDMASIVMKNGWIDAVVVGCDRMAANGDGANKIGTSGVAILAKEYGIPFYMYVPTSTVDMDTPSGDDIDIELRSGEEIYRMWYEHDMAPTGVRTYNPSFDVTDNKYITAVITEKGIIKPPFRKGLEKLLGKTDGKEK